jgi:N-acetylneuraminate synthase
MDDVHRAVEAGLEINPEIAVMQCNTNYTGSLENFKYINLNVLKTFRQMYPEMVLGLSDHTPGHATVLGAVALGAKIIEKHFTDDNLREGPDHAFSMDPIAWREMVSRTRELEAALGSGVKKIEDNESTTAILQRRCIRLARPLPAGARISKEDLEVLRPCPPDGLPPYRMQDVIGRQLRADKMVGEHLAANDFY